MDNLKVWGEVGEDIDHNTMEQMYNVMKTEPVVQGALMPDAHVGYGMPIGGVALLEDAISPGFVGYDIACRMHLTTFDVEPGDVMDEVSFIAQHVRDSTRFGVGASWNKRNIADHAIMSDLRWKELPEDVMTLTYKDGNTKSLMDMARVQLGTSGSGNHFANLMLGEWLRPVVEAEGRKHFIALMTHSGSRGVGWNIARHYMGMAQQWEDDAVGKGYGYLPLDHDLGREYWIAMSLMGDYAKANHEIIHQRFAEKSGLPVLRTFDNHHNFAWKTDRGFIHRKGATPASEGEFGIIPGSSGTYSYLVKGLGNPDSLWSSSHGAGRVSSRSQAKQNLDEQAFIERMKEWNILHYGIAKDETYQAYKDIERVMDMQSDLVHPVARMRPLVVVMGGGRR